MIPVSPVLPKAPTAREVRFGKDQPEYIPLPGVVSRCDRQMVTTRWRLTWGERLRVLFTGHLYLQMLTFGNKLQPVKLQVEHPDVQTCLGVPGEQLR